MQTFGSLGNFWCPRCGTIVRVGGTVAGVPMLVERCRAYAADDHVMVDSWARGKWDQLGIAESIERSQER